MKREKIFAKGAEGRLYEVEYDGKKALCKRREVKKYRVVALDAALRRRRTRREAKALRLARENGVAAPELFLQKEFELVMQKLNGTLLSRKTRVTQAQARQAGEMLGKLHACGITHGDFSTSNLMEVGGKVFVIDFGLCNLTRSLEERADDCIVFEKSVENARLAEAFRKGYGAVARDAKTVFGRAKQVLGRARYGRAVA